MANEPDPPSDDLSAEEKRKSLLTEERSEYRQVSPKARPASADLTAESDMGLALAQGPPKVRPETAVLPNPEQKTMREEIASAAFDATDVESASGTRSEPDESG